MTPRTPDSIRRFPRCRLVAVLLLVSGTLCGPLWAQDEPGVPADEAGLWEQIQEWYRVAKEKGEKVPSDVYEWARQDLQNVGDWEYKVFEIPFTDPAQVQEELNRHGAERWECIWIEVSGERARFVMKRPRRSYLENISKTDVMKILPTGDAKDEEN